MTYDPGTHTIVGLLLAVAALAWWAWAASKAPLWDDPAETEAAAELAAMPLHDRIAHDQIAPFLAAWQAQVDADAEWADIERAVEG